MREFVPGDRIRRVNWRASARRGELWVNEAHPERNADVVLFLDTFAEARDGASGHARPDGARGRLARRALPAREGPRRPRLLRRHAQLAAAATGLVQLYRIVDALLESEIVLSYAWKDIDIIPRRTLPPKALVLALSPLLDERAVRGAARPARARLRPRGRRGLAGAVRRAGRPARSTARAPALGAAARRAARALPAARRAGRRVAATASRSPAALEEVRAFRRHVRVVRA